MTLQTHIHKSLNMSTNSLHCLLCSSISVIPAVSASSSIVKRLKSWSTLRRCLSSFNKKNEVFHLTLALFTVSNLHIRNTLNRGHNRKNLPIKDKFSGTVPSSDLNALKCGFFCIQAAASRVPKYVPTGNLTNQDMVQKGGLISGSSL